MAKRVPEGPPPPPIVQRVRIRYTKRGRLRFTSHRDLARALERAIRRANLPIAFSAGFNPHPKVSYVNAAPTGVASEAEYFEIALSEVVDVARLLTDLDASLPPGIDVLEVVESGGGNLPERMEASRWELRLAPDEGLAEAFEAFMASESVVIDRVTKSGRKDSDVRAAVVGATLETLDGYAILGLVVRTATPTVRPDDILIALGRVGTYTPSEPVVATRLAQGPLLPDGELGDPLAPDRAASAGARP